MEIGTRAVGEATDQLLRYGTLLGVGATIAAATLAGGEGGPVLCPYRICTGGYCPACGLSRGAAALIRGDIGSAWGQHPFSLLLGIGAATALPVALLSPHKLRKVYGKYAGTVATWLGLALISVWVCRLALGDIPRGWSGL